MGVDECGAGRMCGVILDGSTCSNPKANCSGWLTGRHCSTGRLVRLHLLCKKNCFSKTPKLSSFTTDAVVEVSFIAALCRASISDGTALILPYSCITG